MGRRWTQITQIEEDKVTGWQGDKVIEVGSGYYERQRGVLVKNHGKMMEIGRPIMG